VLDIGEKRVGKTNIILEKFTMFLSFYTVCLLLKPSPPLVIIQDNKLLIA